MLFFKIRPKSNSNSKSNIKVKKSKPKSKSKSTKKKLGKLKSKSKKNNRHYNKGKKTKNTKTSKKKLFYKTKPNVKGGGYSQYESGIPYSTGYKPVLEPGKRGIFATPVTIERYDTVYE